MKPAQKAKLIQNIQRLLAELDVQHTASIRSTSQRLRLAVLILFVSLSRWKWR